MTTLSQVLFRAALLVAAVASPTNGQAPRLTPAATIGCESCAGPALLSRVNAISVERGGGIVIVDNSPPMIRTFQSSGTPGIAFARAGSGPGELRSPMAVGRHRDRTFSVVDLGRRALLRFDSVGADLGTIQLDGFPTAASFAIESNTVLIGMTSAQSPDLRLVRVGADNKLVPVSTITPAEFPRRTQRDASGLSIATLSDGSFVIGDGAAEYLIRRYSAAGVFLSEIRRDVAKVKRTPEEINAIAQQRANELGKMQQMMGRGGPPPAASTAGIPTERNYFSAYALQFDEKGNLWVRVERAPLDSTTFDIFDARGRLLGEVTLPHAITDFALGAGLFAGVTTNASGVLQVIVWRVQ